MSLIKVIPGRPDTCRDAQQHELRAAFDLHERRQVEAVGEAIDRQVVLVLAAHFTADAEVVAGAGDQDDLDVGIAFGDDAGLLDAVIRLDGERVTAIGAVDADRENAVVLIGDEMT
jgi:hypothetical protein